MGSVKECVLKLVPECPTAGFWHINFPNADSETVVWACGRCVGTLVRREIWQTGKSPAAVERG